MYPYNWILQLCPQLNFIGGYEEVEFVGGGRREGGLVVGGLTAKSVLVASGCAKKRGDRFAQCSVFVQLTSPARTDGQVWQGAPARRVNC